MKFVFLGRLADLAGANERETHVDHTLDWDGITAQFEEALAEQLHDERTKVALNGKVVADKAKLRAEPGDEIAFLPPVSGG